MARITRLFRYSLPSARATRASGETDTMSRVADSTARWTAADVPDQSGRTAVVTGANSGVGLEAARVLAGRGATVVLACRDAGRAGGAADRITADFPAADLRIVRLDLASLASVREAAREMLDACGRIDLLINNAGLMMPPYRTTEDGFEQQFGVNHLGHFALSGLLIGRMLESPGSRVVTMSSIAHRAGSAGFGNVSSGRGYRRGAAYGRSKLANLLFTYELQRRLAAAGAGTAALAAHPGYARTSLPRNLSPAMKAGSQLIERLFAQSAPMGALPVLRAATDPGARGGEFYGPGSLMGSRGYPVRASSSARSRDTGLQRRLWEQSERLTGVTYPL